MANGILAIIERGSGAGERQYQDLLYFCVGMRTQFGGLDLVLRGSAVTCALRAPDKATTPKARPAAGDRPSLPEPRRYLRALIRSGVRVWAERADLEALGHHDMPLVEGVSCTNTDALAGTWHTYQGVWFL